MFSLYIGPSSHLSLAAIVSVLVSLFLGLNISSFRRPKICNKVTPFCMNLRLPYEWVCLFLCVCVCNIVSLTMVAAVIGALFFQFHHSRQFMIGEHAQQSYI